MKMSFIPKSILSFILFRLQEPEGPHCPNSENSTEEDIFLMLQG